MDHNPLYYLRDAVDNSRFLPISETPSGALMHNPTISMMNAVSLASPSPLTAPDLGPFVTMHVSYYSSLMNQLEVEGLVQPSGTNFSGHPPESATSPVAAGVIPTINAPFPDAQAPGSTLRPPARVEGGTEPRKLHSRRRSKVACYSCSDAHKTCDQGHPCGRCTKRGIDASCEYPPTKGGRRVRKAIIPFTNAEHCAGMSSVN